METDFRPTSAASGSAAIIGAVERTPLEADVGSNLWSASRLAQATAFFVVLGVLLRVVRYLLNYPLYCDESMFAANLLDRGYLDLLRPLDYRQVSPVLFTWVELTAVRWLGFSELSLRLFPALCGVSGVLLFRHLAGRLLGGVPLLLAVAVFAVSGGPIRYAAEVKPYASDLLMALGLLALAIEWWRTPGQAGWLWALAALAPVAVALSFPAIFVAGGIGLGLLVPAWRARRPVVWMAYGTFNVTAVASFGLLIAISDVSSKVRSYMQDFWAGAFPPLDRLGNLLAWLVSTHTGPLFAYPEGGEHGASLLTFACFLTGAFVLGRRGRGTALALLLAPFGLALIAAAMHRYPYGLSNRTTQYTVPAICLLSGLGAAALLARVRRPEARLRGLRGLLIALAALGFGRMGLDLVHPYRGATDDRARAFARWFWIEIDHDAEVACIKRDLGTVLNPEHWDHDMTDMYLCYQKMYSPRHRRGVALRLDLVSAAHPLRCVLFNEGPKGNPAFETWMARMLSRYDLRRSDRYPVSEVDHQPGRYFDNLYLVYEFVPKAGKPSPPVAQALKDSKRR